MLIPDFISLAMVVLYCIAGGTLLELVGNGETQGWVSRLRGLMFWMFYLAGIAIAASLSRLLSTTFSFKPLLTLDFRLSASSDNLALAVLSIVVLPFIPALVSDFLYYWFHRLQHAVPFLWRFHAVHHAIEELNIANSAHHFTDGIFKLPFILVPLTFLIQIRVTDVLFISIFLTFWSNLIHANSRISLGPLDFVFVRPLYHRIHHSQDPQHHNRNFCAVFPIWDILFGTAYFPARDARVTTGLPEQSEAKTISQYLFALPPSRKEKLLAEGRPDHYAEDIAANRSVSLPQGGGLAVMNAHENCHPAGRAQ
jgi:sterol desaturase/sphingolipid hydroxylase (fatty acid hydroxylase superfamily)